MANYNAVPDFVFFCMSFVLKCHDNHACMHCENEYSHQHLEAVPPIYCCASPSPLVQSSYAIMYITLHT